MIRKAHGFATLSLALCAFSASFLACSHAADHADASDDDDHGHTGMTAGAAASSTPIASVSFDALFVVNGADSTISVIDTSKNEVAGTIVLSNAAFPHHLYLSPDRTKLALSVPGVDFSGGHSGHSGHAGMMGGVVMLLDATTGATLGARTFPAMNHNAAFSPSGLEIWTSQMETPGKALILDSSSLEEKQRVEVGGGPAEITFSADGKFAYVANGESGTVTVIDVATKAVVTTVPTGGGPVGAWQGSNGIAYVDNESAKTLSAIDTKTNAVTHSYSLGFTPGYAALAPSGALWVTDADVGRVVLFPADVGGPATGSIATGAGAHAIAFSADGTTGYVSNQNAASVSVIDIGTGTVKKTIAVGNKPNGMVWRAR